MKTEIIEKDVETLISKADILINSTITNVNNELINFYWNIGKLVYEYKKENNAKYGDNIIKKFSEELAKKYGKGFNNTNIKYAINFYYIFSKGHARDQFNKKVDTHLLLKNVSWTHIRELLKLKDIKIIGFYLSEIESKKISYRELLLYIKSKSYERIIINQKDNKLINNEIEKTLKDPMILNIENKKEVKNN